MNGIYDQAGRYANIPAPIPTTQAGEQVDIVTVIANKYRARQMDSFKFVGTVPNQWVMCEITGMSLIGTNLTFKVPENYKVVTPYISMIEEADKAEINLRLALLAHAGWSVCELCGHAIKYPFPIRCDSKEFVMWIGSECVNNFLGAGYTLKQIKVFKETRLRQEFNDWIESAISFCTNAREARAREIIFVKTQNPKAVECELCHTRIIDEEGARLGHTRTCKFQVPYWKLTRIPEEYYKFRQQLWRMQATKMSARKILNTFQKAQGLRIPIGEEVTKVLEIEEKAREMRQARKQTPVENNSPTEDQIADAELERKNAMSPKDEQDLYGEPDAKAIDNEIENENDRAKTYEDQHEMERQPEPNL